MTRNLGGTPLRRRKRSHDPMVAFDALPGPLRCWLTEATLPWSPISARRVWRRARADGLGIEATLDRLTRCETATLARVGSDLAPGGAQPNRTHQT